MSITVRRADKNDAEGIVALLCEIAEFHHKGRPDIFKSGFSKYDTEEYRQIVERDDVHIFAAEAEDGKIVGYAISFYNDFKGDKAKHPTKYLYLDDLCVTAAYRKSGLGKALMDKVFEQARLLGCDKIELNVWNFDGNAFDFYKKYGFDTTYYKMEAKL